MTEEINKGCEFQQNYNVFGLDDKPCCYLYHKYCGEIDSCYFKRCTRLEQENKELKEQAQLDGECIDKLIEARDMYANALEEISGLASPHCTQCSQIINIINEVLGNECRE